MAGGMESVGGHVGAMCMCTLSAMLTPSRPHGKCFESLCTNALNRGNAAEWRQRFGYESYHMLQMCRNVCGDVCTFVVQRCARVGQEKNLCKNPKNLQSFTFSNSTWIHHNDAPPLRSPTAHSTSLTIATTSPPDNIRICLIFYYSLLGTCLRLLTKTSTCALTPLQHIHVPLKVHDLQLSSYPDIQIFRAPSLRLSSTAQCIRQ